MSDQMTVNMDERAKRAEAAQNGACGQMGGKTCGTCKHFVLLPESFPNGLCGESVNDDEPRFAEADWECPWEKLYEVRTDSLEQVACDLAHEFRKMMVMCSLPSSNEWEMVHATIEDAERRLKALGVEL